MWDQMSNRLSVWGTAVWRYKPRNIAKGGKGQHILAPNQVVDNRKRRTIGMITLQKLALQNRQKRRAIGRYISIDTPSTQLRRSDVEASRRGTLKEGLAPAADGVRRVKT